MFYKGFSDIVSPFAGLNGSVAGDISPLAGKLFVVLGAGGAGKSLAYGAAKKGARVVVSHRTYGSFLPRIYYILHLVQ